MAFIGTSAPHGTISYDSALQGALAAGWVMVSEGPSGAQMNRPKRMTTGTKLCLVVGVLSLPLWGIGAFLILVGILNHVFFTKEQAFFIQRDTPALPSA